MMDIDMSEMVYRAAEAGDYQGVLDLSQGLYGGRDIVPAMYHDYLKDPLRVVYVAVYKGNVVAFGVSKMVDNGTVMEAAAGRTHPDVRGTGIFTNMSIMSYTEVIGHRFPSVTKIRGVTVQTEHAAGSNSKANVPRSLRTLTDIAWKEQISVIEEASYLYESKFKSPNTVVIQHAEATDIKEIFTSFPFKSQFIPTGILVRDSQTFGLDYPENIPLVLGDRCRNIFISRDSDEQMTSVSFGTGVEMGVHMDTFKYTIDYYGASDLSLLKAQVMKHVGEVPRLFQQSRTAKDVYICVFVLDEAFNSVDLEELLKFTSKCLRLSSGDRAGPATKQVVMQSTVSLKKYVNRGKL